MQSRTFTLEVVTQSWISAIVGKADIGEPSGQVRHRRASLVSAPASNTVKTSPELAERRSAVLRGFFPKLASWFEDAVERSRRREIEDYLAQSQNLADLEERIRRLDRGTGFPYH